MSPALLYHLAQYASELYTKGYRVAEPILSHKSGPVRLRRLPGGDYCSEAVEIAAMLYAIEHYVEENRTEDEDADDPTLP